MVSAMKHDPGAPYEIIEYSHEPGLYFEEIGQMTQAESYWKLVINLDINALEVRYHDFQECLEDTINRCSKTADNVRHTCKNILQVIERQNIKTSTLLTQLRTVFKVTHRRRGLVNVIGTISKTLFGTMDAEDEKIIYEQINLLKDNDKALKHAVKNQLKVLNATIAHIDGLEKILTYNENRIMSTTRRMDKQLAHLTLQEDMNEHLLVLSAIINELIRDIENSIDYLMYAQDNKILTRLFPVEKVITALKETATHLTDGLHFPFQIHTDNWRNIEKYVTLTAFHDEPQIYTILRIPVVNFPTYKIIKAISFPARENNNVLSFIKIEHPLLAINTENRQYKVMQQSELDKCIKNVNTYTCEQNFATYYSDTHAPCEVQVYIQMPGQLTHCEKQQIASSTTVWIALSEENAWLYSTPKPQEASITCKTNAEEKIVLNTTGKIVLRENCKLKTPHVILSTRKPIETKYIQTYLPEYNLTLENKNKKYISEIKRKQEILKPIIKDPVELTKLSLSVKEIDEALNEEEYTFHNPKVVYPIGIGTTIMIIGIAIGTVFILRKRKNKKRNKQKIEEQQRNEDIIMY